MYKLFPLSALAVAVTHALPSHAQEQLEEIIVVSSRVEMPLRQVGTSVSVLTEQDIQQAGFNSLFDVLRTQPGIAVSNAGGAGKTTSLRIRGEEGFRTLVRIDGIDISDASSPQVAPRIENIMSSGIERVEILRGPQGMMYGADAGGVINISTYSPEPGFNGNVSAEGGHYGTGQFAANLRGGNETVDASLSASHFQTDGFNARTTDTELQDDDGYKNQTVHARAGWNVTDAFRLEVVGRDTHAENEFDSCFTNDTFAATDRCDSDFDQQAWRLSADYSAGRFTNQFKYTGNNTKQKSFAEGQETFATDGSIERLGYIGSFKASDPLQFVYGLERKEEAIDSGPQDSDRTQDGYYAEYQGGFSDQFYITAGARHDRNEDFGNHTSYRLSGAYLFGLGSGEAKLRGAYGTGFRAPSLFEIAYNQGDAALPPASENSLQEETSAGYDIGLSWLGQSGIELEATYFDQTVTDEIYFDVLNFSGYLQGDGNTQSTGVELLAAFPLHATLWLTGNYTYNDTDNASGSVRIRRPRHLSNVSLNWQPMAERLSLGLHVRGAWDAQDIDDSSTDDYQVVDITASFDIFDALEVFGRVENLFDADYEEVPTYNTSGTAAYAGIRYTF